MSGELKEAVERVTARLRASIGVIDPRGSRTPIYNNPEGPEAADLIEQMAATLEAMASALEPLARDASGWPDYADDDRLALTDRDGSASAYDITVGELRAARTTLTQYRQGDL